MKLNPLRRCWVEIDLSALRHNAEQIREWTGSKVGLMAVVKADAYGHGLEQVAAALVDHVEWFCVANVREGLRVKARVPSGCPPILVLSPITPDECETAILNGFSCSVSSVDEVAKYGDFATGLESSVKLHAVADTGMGRMGASAAEWGAMLDAICDHPNCQLEGVATHFPNADEDVDFTRNQISQFQAMIEGLDCVVHLSNSAGIIDFSGEMPFANCVRPGLAIYGVSPDCQEQIALKPALTMKTRVTLIREIPPGTTISYGSTFQSSAVMKVASLAVGYGDGYPRHLSGSNVDVLIGGVRCPMLGRVTMDQIVVDVTHLPDLESGEEVILIGTQNGDTISAAELATKAGTIPWEIFTGITSRVERVCY